jgi:hypothetical protein
MCTTLQAVTPEKRVKAATMRALVFRGPNQIAIEQVSIPRPGPGLSIANSSFQQCRVPGDCARALARLGCFASSEADVKIAAPSITFGPQHAPSHKKCSPRVRIEAGRNAGLKNTVSERRDQERKNATKKSRTLSVQAQFILSVGNEACGFLQEFHVSELANLHAKPYASSLSPCLLNQFVPFWV